MKSKIVGEGTFIVEVSSISKYGFWIFVKEKEYFLSFEDFPWFRNANVSSILNVKFLLPNHLYWPDLDVDLELDSLESPQNYPLIYKPI